MSKKWKIISSRIISHNKWNSITKDVYRAPCGFKIKQTVFHKNPFASIIPWDGQRFILVGQYRHVIDFYSWEFPAGHFHESIERTAKDELEEETGYCAENFKFLGYFYLAPGHHTQQCHVFLATGLKKIKVRRDAAEIAAGMKVKKVTLQALEKMIKTGKIKDGPTMAGYSLLQSHGFFKKV